MATIWNGSVPTALPAPAGLVTSQANAINNAGQVVGQAGNTDYPRRYLEQWHTY